MKNMNTILKSIVAFSLVISSMACSSSVFAEDKTETVTIKGLTLELPADWKKKNSNRPFRLGEFDVPGAEGQENGELILYHFQGRAGSTDDNIKRWIKQFDPKGRKVTLKEGKTESGDYVWVDVTGNYKKPVGPPVFGKFQLMENARVISVILNTGSDVYYLKLVGDQKSITSHEAAYRKSFGGNADKESEYKPESE